MEHTQIFLKKQCWIILPLSCSFWPRWFFVHNSSHKRKRKQTKSEKKRDLPSWAHKMSLAFPSVCRVCFHTCSMLCETKGQGWGNNILFRRRKHSLFKEKSTFHSNWEKKPTLLPSQIKRNRAERELRLPLWHLAATRPWLTSTVTLRLCSCREKGPHKTAVEERSWREIVGFLSVWILLGQDFTVRLKMCNRCSQMLGIV